MSGELLSIWHGAINHRPTWREIVDRVACQHDIAAADLLGLSQKLKFAHPRQQAYAEIRAIWGLSFPAIGRLLHRDHTSVRHGIRRYRERMAA